MLCQTEEITRLRHRHHATALRFDGFSQGTHARAGNIIHAKILIHNDDGKIKFHNLSFALISREALLEQPWRESVLYNRVPICAKRPFYQQLVRIQAHFGTKPPPAPK